MSSCSAVSPVSMAAYTRPVQPVAPVRPAAQDSDGDSDGDTAPVKAATPDGVGNLIDISA
jgi:hypothetical protein